MADMTEFNRALITEFRANQGKVGGQFANAPLLLLTSIGAKSGRSHTTPLAYSKDGDRLIVIASKAGSPNNPAWYHNLVANPEVTVELGSESCRARAFATKGEERERLFNAQAKQMPVFFDYQKKTTRQIPVIALERIK
jgi:deazaflavin-dependent oxidoreductase (nitroreductase family)